METAASFGRSTRHLVENKVQSCRVLADGIETTVNALVLQKVVADHDESTTKTKKKHFPTLFKTRPLKHLKLSLAKKRNAKKSSISSIDEKTINLCVILLRKETNRCEAFTFKLNIGDKVSVEDLIKHLPLYASDPLLHCCLCNEKGLELENSELLQTYFLPSMKTQCVIAVPGGMGLSQSLKVAKPFIAKLKVSMKNSVEISTNNGDKIIPRHGTIISRNGTNDDDDVVSLLQPTGSHDSIPNIADGNASAKEIIIPDYVFIIMGLLFMYAVNVGFK